MNHTTPVFAFDLHGVVFKKDIWRIIRKIATMPLSVRIVLLGFNPVFLYDFFSALYWQGSAEEIIVKLAQKYPVLAPYIPIGIDIANEQIVRADTVKIMRELKERGYRLLILSNIGITTFKLLQKKFPDVFELFDGYQVCGPENNWLQKPYKKAYEQFITFFNLAPESTIFIDDKKSNIKGALRVGIQAIHFTSATALANKLKALGINHHVSSEN